MCCNGAERARAQSVHMMPAAQGTTAPDARLSGERRLARPTIPRIRSPMDATSSTPLLPARRIALHCVRSVRVCKRRRGKPEQRVRVVQQPRSSTRASLANMEPPKDAAGGADAVAADCVQLMDLDDHLLVAVCSFLGFLELLRLQQARGVPHTHAHARVLPRVARRVKCAACWRAPGAAAAHCRRLRAHARRAHAMRRAATRRAPRCAVLFA